MNTHHGRPFTTNREEPLIRKASAVVKAGTWNQPMVAEAMRVKMARATVVATDA